MPSDTGQLDLRVILLGRTGLDGALRLDPTLELVRTRTALEAIGEVSHLMDPSGPTRAVVVVASRVDGLLDEARTDEVRVGEFVSALRLAQPGVVVLGIKNGKPVPGVFDGAVLADAPPESLRKAVRWRPGTREVSGAVEPITTSAAAAVPEPKPAKMQPGPAPRWDEDALVNAMLSAPTPAEVKPPAPPRGAAPTPAARPAEARLPARESGADMALVLAMLRGQDVLPVAVTALRERLSDASLEFLPPAEGLAPDARCAPVAWEGVCYGHLRSSRISPDALGPWARWLGSWLRLRDQHSQLREAAFTDPLTGAWNRRYFQRFLTTALDQAREGRYPVTLLLFDIDDFKKYNDLYGHDAGDEILRETVHLLRSVIRPTDRVCRVGGDEFVVVFHDPPRQEGSRHPADVFAIAQRFQQQILRHRFPKLLETTPGTLTISGGLTTFPWDGATPEDLLRRADQLAMQSKRAGKNAITMGPGAMRLIEE
ncbi:Response regulator PleD [Phycisphaerales bacterium]|nr:Response regulator PleD [Phycisphaerales bacterium]